MLKRRDKGTGKGEFEQRGSIWIGQNGGLGGAPRGNGASDYRQIN